MDKKMKKVIAICTVVSLLFTFFVFAVISTIFNYIRYNDVDRKAVDYIRCESNIADEYGEILYVARKVTRKTIRTDDMMKKSYAIEFTDKEIVVYVEFISKEDGWKAVNYEVIEIMDADGYIIYKK